MNEELKELEHKVNSQLLNLAKFSFTHHIRIVEQLELSPLSDLNDEQFKFEDGLFFSFTNLSVSDSGGTYFIDIQTMGNLKELLEAASISEIITVFLMNQKFRSSIYIDNGFDINKNLIACTTKRTKRRSSKTPAQLQSLLTDLSKLCTIYALKYGCS